MRRAAHQLLDDPRVHEDPLALAILGSEEEKALRAAPRRLEDGPISAALRAFLVVRSRIAEDALSEAVARGVEQYVVLGAGLDTFAYRNPFPNLRVFEVDHPSTLAWKRQRLADAGIAIPDGVTFAAVDFASEALTDALRRAGVNEAKPSFFSWLGVTPYLTPEDTLKTLAAIAPLTVGGGGVTFDYSIPPSSLGLRARLVFEALAARVAAAGEPFRGFFEPEALAAPMREMGFSEIVDMGPDELNSTYFAGRKDGLRVGSAGRVVTAKG